MGPSWKPRRPVFSQCGSFEKMNISYTGLNLSIKLQERRLQAIQELVKILRVGGKALIYVWAMEQQLNKVKSKYLKNSKGQGHGGCGSGGQGEQTDEMCEGEKCSSAQRGVLVPNTADFDISEIEQKHLSDKNPVIDNLGERVCDMNINVCEGNATDEHVIDEHVCSKSEAKGLDGIQCNNSNGNLKTSNSELSDINHVLSAKENMTEHNKSIIKTSYDTKTEKVSEDTTNTENCDKKSVASIASDNTMKSKLPVHVNRTEFKQQDLLVPWQLKGKKEVEKERTGNTFHRFYHVFKKGELESLCSKVQDCKVIHSYYDQGNWAVVLQKV